MSRSKILLACLSFFMGATAFAGPVYQFSIDNPPGSANAGDITNVTTSYDTNTEVFSWSYTITADGSSNFSDGFWLVVTDGENPKNDPNEYGIMYGDLASNSITVYEYSGQNNANSWNNPGIFLESFTGFTSVSNGSTNTLSFSIDVSGVNSSTAVSSPSSWKGVNFGEKIGIWFHPSTGTSVGFNGNGEITSFGYTNQGWYDASNQTTTSVPEPDYLVLLALGLLALGIRQSVSNRKEQLVLVAQS